MRILVVGATGPTGLEILKQGQKLGHEITAVVRHPEKTELTDAVRVLKGDVTDIASLEKAVTNQDAVLCSLGSKLSRKPTTLLSGGTRNLVKAMQNAGVARLLCITGIGAGDSKGHGGFLYDRLVEPLLLHEIYLDKTRQEEVVRESDLDWTLVRPAQLTNGVATGKVRIYTDLNGITVDKISRADVAAFLLARVGDESTFRQTYTVSY